ncbi:MAG: hypothetical protein EBS96_04705 [Spartobacteria bacterium]|nr:hypothetical protein [Spartobacteria bacterium]
MSRQNPVMPSPAFLVFFLILTLAHFACAESSLSSFAYILQADSFTKTKSAAVAQLQESGRDWIVLDAAFAGDTRWERADLDAIRSGKAGRKVVAYLSIGEAEGWQAHCRRTGVARDREPGVEGELSGQILERRMAKAHAGRDR